MPDLHSHIFSLALDAFLRIGAVKLTIEQLIPLVMLFKKLKATTRSDSSGESEELELRSMSAFSNSAPARIHSKPGLELNQPFVSSIDTSPSQQYDD